MRDVQPPEGPSQCGGRTQALGHSGSSWVGALGSGVDNVRHCISPQRSPHQSVKWVLVSQLYGVPDPKPRGLTAASRVLFPRFWCHMRPHQEWPRGQGPEGEQPGRLGLREGGGGGGGGGEIAWAQHGEYLPWRISTL